MVRLWRIASRTSFARLGKSAQPSAHRAATRRGTACIPRVASGGDGQPFGGQRYHGRRAGDSARGHCRANTDGSTALGESGSDSDQIVFAPDQNGTIAVWLGQMEITQSLTLTGHGPDNTIIDTQQNSRIFEIEHPAGDVTLDGFTLKNSRTAADGREYGGGAICSTTSSFGKLTLRTAR